MKKIIIYITLLVSLMLVASIAAASSSNPYDEIPNYIIRIDMLSDGSMNIEYTLEWVALRDSNSDRLNYMKIGIPNRYADEFIPLSDTIKDIRLLTGGGSFAYLNLDREYRVADMANGPVRVNFRIHQNNMYTYKKDTDELWYAFTPGWFDYIEVKSLTIYWNSVAVKSSNAHGITEDGYLFWKGENLSTREQKGFEAQVHYDVRSFPDLNQQQVETSESGGGLSAGAIVLIVLGVILLIIIVASVIAYYSDEFDDSDSGGSSGGGSSGGSCFTSIRTSSCVRSSCVRSSCACVKSSCACVRSSCACACASGGRVGCSRKNLVQFNLDELKTALKKN